MGGIRKILVAGAGSIGRRHMRIARMLNPDADIRALRRSAGDDLPEGANGCLTQLDDALAFAPQLVVLANPATMHVSAARPFADLGAHLLIEKPLAASAEMVPELLEACRRSGSIVMVDYNLRFMHSLQHLRQLLTEQRIGLVLSVRAEAGQYLPSWRPGLDYRSVVSAHRELGGGVLLELSHELDYLRWLFGEVCWVQARLARQSALQIDVEDTVHMLLGFERRAGDSELTASLNIDFIRHDAVRQCTVIGEEGSLRWNARAGTVEFFQPGDAAWRGVFDRPEARDDTYIAVWKHLLECVETGAAPLVSGEDGLSVLRIIDAARESSQRNRTVTVGSPGT